MSSGRCSTQKSSSSTINPRSGELAFAVAQVSNLLYRRFPIGRTLARQEPISVCRLEALRYSRLETCATCQLADFVNGAAIQPRLAGSFLIDITQTLIERLPRAAK